MTTISYRDGVLAGDSRGVCNNWIEGGAQSKVRKLPDGRLVAFTGEPCEAIPFVSWLSGRRKDRPALTNARVVVVDRRGRVMVHEGPGEFQARGRFFAWGSGMPAALAAMYAGASAVEAVKIAAKVDPGTGGAVRSVVLTGRSRIIGRRR